MLSFAARRAARSAAAAAWRAPPQQALLRTSATAHFSADPEINLDKPQVRPVGSPKVQALVDQIVGLNMLEVADLTEILKERLGLTGLGGQGMMMMPGMGAPAAAGAAPAAAGAAPAAAAAKTEFDVKLDGFDPANKIKIIKEVRAATGLGLKEAKDLVRAPPHAARRHVGDGPSARARSPNPQTRARMRLRLACLRLAPWRPLARTPLARTPHMCPMRAVVLLAC
jgi:large subunit ribosomal protein L7/L12